MAEIKRKRGRPSKAEVASIKENANKMTTDEMADKLGRTKEWVQDVVKGDSASSEAQEMLMEFRQRIEYRQLQEKFTKDEIVLFEHKYVKMMIQFNKDVLYTEESQIFMVITYELLIDKNLKKMKEIDEQIFRMMDELHTLYSETESDKEEDKQRRLAKIARLNETISQLRGVQARLDKTINEFASNILKQWELIKGARNQRIGIIENSKKNFIDLLKSFENGQFRDEQGRETELVRIAAEREKARIGQSHKYMDGTFDIPFLSADTIGEDEEDE
jgi:hypothetical protein